MKSILASKKKAALTAAASLLVLTGLSVSAYAASGMKAIPKNQLMTETDSAYSAAVTSPAGLSAGAGADPASPDGAVTEARAVEIASNALSAMIGVDLSGTRLKHEAVYVDPAEARETNYYKSSVWQINWMSADSAIEKSSSAFESHSVTVNAETGEIVAIRSDGTKAPSTSIRTITEEQGKARVREFIENNGLAKGTSIGEIRLSGFFGKALLGKVQLENGKQASVVISRLNEDIIGYEGDVKKSVYEEQTLPDDPNGAPSAQVKQP